MGAGFCTPNKVSTFYKILVKRMRIVLKITVLWIHLILMLIRILDPHWKKWIQIRIQVISLRFTEFSEQSKIFKFVVLFLCKNL